MRWIDEFSRLVGMNAGLMQQWLLTADCSTPWRQWQEARSLTPVGRTPSFFCCRKTERSGIFFVKTGTDPYSWPYPTHEVGVLTLTNPLMPAKNGVVLGRGLDMELVRQPQQYSESGKKTMVNLEFYEGRHVEQVRLEIWKPKTDACKGECMYRKQSFFDWCYSHLRQCE